MAVVDQYAAQAEREFNRQRQAEEIAAAKEPGAAHGTFRRWCRGMISGQ